TGGVGPLRLCGLLNSTELLPAQYVGRCPAARRGHPASRLVLRTAKAEISGVSGIPPGGKEGWLATEIRGQEYSGAESCRPARKYAGRESSGCDPGRMPCSRLRWFHHCAQ